MAGRTVKLFLVDGNANGIVLGEIINWTCMVTVAPRSQLAQLAQRDEIRRSGVYILSGYEADSVLEETVYIGESENVWLRLSQHNNDDEKNFWTRTVVISSKDDNLTKAHIRYLESRLIAKAEDAGRASIKNGTSPEPISLPESDRANMEEFLEQIEMLLPVLGFNFAVPIRSKSPQITQENASSQTSRFVMNYEGAKAFMQEINGEFIVLKGSTARKTCTPSFKSLPIREQLQSAGKLSLGSNADFLEFLQDVPFKSPSTSATIIGGTPLNGRYYWRDEKTGKTYSEIISQQVDEANKSVKIETED